MRSHLTVGALLAMLLVAHGCNGASDEAPTSAPAPTEVTGAEVEVAAPGSAPAECQTDLDCETCWTGPSCSCRSVAAGTDCGPTTGRCLAPPCRLSSASCWANRCQLRPSSAAPCASDEECEVRADDCACDLYAALASAPEPELCRGQGCGARPNPAEYRASCDTDHARCVLQRAAPSR